MAVRIRHLLVSTTLLLAGGCFYDFNNPVTQKPNGSISGQLVLVNQAQGQTLSGATVTLEWSGSSVAVNESTGAFTFRDLPAGTFTLRYDLPPAAGNLFPLIGFRHDLVLPGDPGAADAINLGVLPITPSGKVQGTVSGGSGGPIVLGAFTPLQPDGGGHQFEDFAATTDSVGAFSMILPAGNHDLACSTSSAVNAQPVTLVSQQVVLKDLSLAPAALPGSSVDGFLVLGDQGVNAPRDVVDQEFIQLGGVTSTVVAEDGTGTTTGPLVPGSQQPGVGAPFEQGLAPGHEYTVTFSFNAGQDVHSCSYFPPLVLKNIPAIAGDVARLGQVAWLQAGVLIENGRPGSCITSDGGVIAFDGGAVDAGAPTWQLLNAAAPQDAGAVEELVPLPIGDGDGGTKGHRLAWVQADGLVYTTDDVASGGTTYGPTTQIWSTGADPVFSITGASTAAGGAAFGWVERNLSQATIAYYPPGAGSETPVISSFALLTPPSNVPSSMALVAGNDSAGAAGLWVLILEDASTGGLLEYWFTKDFMNYTQASPNAPTPLKAGQVVGTPCSLPELDGGAGVCIAATVNWVFDDHWAYQAVLDPQPATPTLAVQLIVDAGSGQNFGSPAITAAPVSAGSALSTVATGWTLNTPTGAEYQVSQFTTLSNTPTETPLISPYGPLDPDGILLQWQGAPLSVATFPNHNPNGVGSISLGTAMPPPFLPGWGVTQLLHGYTAANGDLIIAVYDRASTDLTAQLALFVWPPPP